MVLFWELVREGGVEHGEVVDFGLLFLGRGKVEAVVDFVFVIVVFVLVEL